jgi:hypothetical protein
MSELSFSQPERRSSLLIPLLIAFVVVGGISAYVYLRPHRIADITITHTNILPTHTVFRSLSKVVGHEDEAQDDLYILTTLHIDNRSKIPLTIDDITATLTPPDDSAEPTTASAIPRTDLDGMYVTFPALKPLSGPPLPRETTIQPGGHAEGMVMLHFPVTEADWNNRKSASITISFYHQDPLTLTIPKDQGTGNSK